MARNPPTCPFCTPGPSVILLAIPFRHVASFFEVTGAEQAALLSLVHDARRLLDERYSPDGYNIGVNIGAAAGQRMKHTLSYAFCRLKEVCK